MSPRTPVDLFGRRWPAHWCRHPDAAHRYRSAVFLYRRTLTLDAEALADGAPFVVHVSADQRYRLYVNGQSVVWGPARGDTRHWRYETVDLAPYLSPGINVLAAHVHYFEPEAMPQAQISVEAAFLMQGDSDREAAVNTPVDWLVHHDAAYDFGRADADALHTYCVVGPSEQMDCTLHPFDWQSPDFDDSAWATPVRIGRAAAPFGLSDSESHWWLVARTIPAMEETPQPFGRVVRASGIDTPADWPASNAPLIIPPRTRATLLLDHGVETCAFPEIVVSGGTGATLRLAYTEALVRASTEAAYESDKGHRDDTGLDRVVRGYADSWTLDGGADRLLRPLWWKTFRYAELTVETGDTALTIDRLTSVYTGYPFEERARFHAPEIDDAPALWEIGWRTARLCAHESYMDCPYYEQLQYIGDTRIQCLVSLYTSGDSRLFRNALAHIDASRLPEGLTQSRFPVNTPQVIPPFSLWYIGMVADYARHVPNDDAFLHSLLPGIRGILDWFRDRLRPDGLLGKLEFWNFVDWANEWSGGVPPGAREGGSAIVTLQYALACKDAGSLCSYFEHPERMRPENEEQILDSINAALDVLDAQANEAAHAVRDLCFEPKTMRVADTPEKTSYSQHAAILAVLADAVPPVYHRKVMERVLADTDLTQTTFYFRFYLNRALVKAGMGDHYLDTLGPWRDMRAIGLTTWAEKPEPTRSDCHAWSSAPNFEFLATVLGIQPGNPLAVSREYLNTFPESLDGWAHIRIEPHLGTLTEASGTVPHPDGDIRVAYRRTGDRLEADIELPAWPEDKAAETDPMELEARGQLFWRGKSVALHPGKQTLVVAG